jgi:Flp pilus assembly protein TadB/Mg-chelatase subunit ChlD
MSPLRTTQRWLVAAMLVASAVVFPGLRAHAATGGASIQDLTVQGGTATFTVTVALPAGSTLVRDRTTVRVGGVPVQSEVTAAQSSTGKARTTVLVVDTSGSMGPGGIAAARSAADAYLARVAADVRVGLVSFADRPHVVTNPTTNRAALRAGLSGLHSNGETALYDAVGVAVRLAGAGGAVVVLSDGADTVSHADLGETLSRIQAASVRVSTVAFRTQDGVRGPLSQIARAGGGHIVAASGASDLAAAFANAAAALPAQLNITATLPAEVTTGELLTVTVAATHGTWDASVALPGTSVAAAPGSSGLASPAASLVGAVPWYGSLALVLLVVFASLLVMVWLLAPRAETAADKRQRVLEVYSVTGRRTRRTPAQATSVTSSGLADTAQRFVDRRGTSAGITRQLEQAGSRLRPGEWLVLRGCTMLAIAAVVTVVGRNLVVGLAAGVVLGWLSTLFWLRHKQSRRARAFADSLPDTLQLVASSLRTGFSLPQALDAAQQDGVQPMAEELGRALAAARIGAPLEDELDLVAERTQSEDWRWAVMAIRIQRSVGGNLAEVLMTTVRTLRERAATRRQVRTLSAEGRLSAYILIGLPILVAGALLTFRRAYLEPLWTTTPGLVMVAGALLLMVLGTFWMRKVVTVEV